MAWLYLVVAGVFEIGWPLGLKKGWGPDGAQVWWLAFGALVLGMPIRGSVFAIAVVCVWGALTFTGLGLLAASRPKTIEAISGVLNMTMLPLWVVCGVFFSAANFPPAVQPVIQALPLTALNDALRAVILEGATLPQVASELAIMAIWAVSTFVLALKLFRWR